MRWDACAAATETRPANTRMGVDVRLIAVGVSAFVLSLPVLVGRTTGVNTGAIVPRRMLDSQPRSGAGLCTWDGWLPPDSARARIRRGTGLSSGDEARYRLLAASPSAQERDRAVRHLGGGSAPSTVATLIGRLEDPSRIVVDGAARALGRLGRSEAIPALGRLAGSGDAQLRQSAVWALGQIADSAAVEVLLLASRDSSKNVRVEATWALGLIGTDDAIRRILELARDDNPHVRRAVICSLGSTGLGRPYDGVVGAALHDVDADVRTAAAWTLSRRRTGAVRSPKERL